MLRKTLGTFLLALTVSTSAMAAKEHGIAMHGALKYKEDQPFEYVNVKAPIGGELRLGSVGTYDSYNPFVTKGKAPGGLNMLGEALVFERLMCRSRDEPFSLYGLIAEKVDVAPDRSSITFTIRPEAKWADGQPITAKDVEFSHKTLKEKGRPNLRLFYSKVKTVEVLSPREIRFTFDKLPDEDRYDPELPLLIGLMTILPHHLWKDKDFEKLTAKDMIGSGPYKIVDSNMGQSISYERRPDYWAWHLPKTKGLFNFNKIRFDYYRNAAVAKEAFKAGEYDVYEESDPNHWAVDYDFKAVKDGQVAKVELAHSLNVGFKGFVFNTRRDFFAMH
jgi:microcin C transport system substrate-binding protein